MLSGHLKYVHELKAGPKTTRDMVLSLMVTGASVARMMKKLRAAGVVESSRVVGVLGNVWQHELVPGYESIVEAMKPSPRRTCHARPAATNELVYIATLRDQGYIGQRLDAEHAKHFPARSRDSMRHLVEVARRRGLCR